LQVAYHQLPKLDIGRTNLARQQVASQTQVASCVSSIAETRHRKDQLGQAAGGQRFNKLANHEDSADPKTHIRFFFPHSPLYSQVAGIRSLIEPKEISDLASAKTIDNQRPIETRLQNLEHFDFKMYKI
jgi:hypothetical protein